MRTDTELKVDGTKVLINELGEVGAERYIALISREPFDYTKWQEKLWIDKRVENISKEAMNFR